MEGRFFWLRPLSRALHPIFCEEKFLAFKEEHGPYYPN